MKIALTGGGTAGSVTPLLAIWREIHRNTPQSQAIFFGTTTGIERRIVHEAGIAFVALPSTKLRRYVSLHTLFIPCVLFWATIRALVHLAGHQPGCVVTAGGFVGVPVVWAAWVLRIPVVVHQPDVRPGLAFILTRAMASITTYGFETTANRFPRRGNAYVTGNPVYGLSRVAIRTTFTNDAPCRVLVLGGGTGSQILNDSIPQAAEMLGRHIRWEVVTGAGKHLAQSVTHITHYQFLPSERLLSRMRDADIIVSRAGASTLAELAVLAKPVILVPLPHSAQVENAREYEGTGAALVIPQARYDAPTLVEYIRQLHGSPARRLELSERISACSHPDSSERIAKIVLSLISL